MTEEIKIERAEIVLEHKVKWLIGLNQDTFLKRLLELGADYLEDNKIFAMCFDTTHPDLLDEMKDYDEVIKAFPSSPRVAGNKFYLGNYSQADYLSVINELLEVWSEPHKYEIVEWVE